MASVTTTTPPRRRRREETRQKLLDSALATFARHGYERATIDEIVREAGFSKGAFYVHFESKDDLFWAMLEGRIARQQGVFLETLDSSISVAANLQAVLTRVFAFTREDPLWSTLFLEFVAHAARNERVRERLAAMYESWRSFAVQIVKQGQEAGIVRKEIEPDFVASVLIAILEGSIVQARLAGDTARLEGMIEPLSRLLAGWIEA